MMHEGWWRESKRFLVKIEPHDECHFFSRMPIIIDHIWIHSSLQVRQGQGLKVHVISSIQIVVSILDLLGLQVQTKGGQGHS